MFINLLHFTQQTRPSLSHNEARAWPEELNSGNTIRMKIINWQLATSCNFVVQSRFAETRFAETPTLTLTLNHNP